MPIRSRPDAGGVKIEKLRRFSSAPRIERCWPAVKTYASPQLLGHLEGERDGVVGQGVDRRDPQRVEGRRHQSALKWSNGSEQERHTHSDLQAVEPKRLVSRVSGLPHCGQRTESARPTGPPRVGEGGATPYAASLAGRLR